MTEFSSSLESKDTIYGVGVFLTFALGAWNLIVNYRTSRRTTFISTVTSQRIQWLEQLRQDIAALCGLTDRWCFPAPSGADELQIVKEIDRLRYVIQLRLKPTGDLDRRIQALILRIPAATNESSTCKFQRTLGELIELSQVLLKEEWEKVKKESQQGNLGK